MYSNKFYTSFDKISKGKFVNILLRGLVGFVPLNFAKVYDFVVIFLLLRAVSNNIFR